MGVSLKILYSAAFIVSLPVSSKESERWDQDAQAIGGKSALQRLETEGPSCSLDLAGARFRASGVEPFWHLDVGADTLSFSRLGHAPMTFTMTALDELRSRTP